MKKCNQCNIDVFSSRRFEETLNDVKSHVLLLGFGLQMLKRISVRTFQHFKLAWDLDGISSHDDAVKSFSQYSHCALVEHLCDY